MTNKQTDKVQQINDDLKTVRTQEQAEPENKKEDIAEEKEKFEKEILIKQTFLPAVKEGEDKPLE